MSFFFLTQRSQNKFVLFFFEFPCTVHTFVVLKKNKNIIPTISSYLGREYRAMEECVDVFCLETRGPLVADLQPCSSSYALLLCLSPTFVLIDYAV